jgi:hypothetical protein
MMGLALAASVWLTYRAPGVPGAPLVTVLNKR